MPVVFIQDAARVRGQSGFEGTGSPNTPDSEKQNKYAIP
jgi:hypothetical protein